MKNFILAAALFGSTSAFAHTDEYLDAQKAPNGGQLRMAGVHHFELVVAKNSPDAKDQPVMVYLSGHDGRQVSSTGASGSATILSGKQKTKITLQPDGDNRLKGTGKYASTPDMKVIVSIALPGKTAEQAKFTPLAPIQDDHAGHQH
ncbi:MAG: hypothetical protein Q8O37_02410 [Sulfuricellaceae bacterium]|nr:hypothetical protein [Sulfuricellaceae bacterium]